MEAFQERDPDNFVDVKGFEAMSEALNRIEKVARFLGSLLFMPAQFAHVAEVVSGAPLNPADDSVAIVGYSGRFALEKGLKELVAKNVEWSATVNEVVKTADSSTKLRPQRDRALESLQNIKAGKVEWSPERLDDLCKLFPELLCGMRAVEIEDVTHLMVEQVHCLASSLLEGKMEVVQGSRLVQGLLTAFKLFSDRAGSTEKASQVMSWMAANESALVLSDLLQLAGKVTADGVSDLDEVQALMARLGKRAVPNDRADLIEAARKILNTSFRALVAEAWWILFWSLELSKASRLAAASS